MEIGWLYGYLTQVDLLPGEVIVGVRGKFILNSDLIESNRYNNNKSWTSTMTLICGIFSFYLRRLSTF
jgi:hypothetical protein